MTRQLRHLTADEIRAMEANSCWAEDWQRVMVLSLAAATAAGD